MKRSRINLKIENLINEGNLCIERAYSAVLEHPEKRMEILTKKGNYFKGAVEKARYAKGMISEIPEKSLRDEYCEDVKEILGRAYSMAAENFMVLAGEAASRKGEYEADACLFNAIICNKSARKFSEKTGEIDSLEIENIKNLARGVETKKSFFPKDVEMHLKNYMEPQAVDDMSDIVLQLKKEFGLDYLSVRVVTFENGKKNEEFFLSGDPDVKKRK